MYVACSTLCFGRHTLEDALKSIAELEFSKFDMAIHEQGQQLRPSQVAADITSAANRLRYGPGLTPAAFSVEIEAANEEDYQRQFQAVCRLARIAMVPLLTLKAAAADSCRDAEVARLSRLVKLADRDGILVTVATHRGTLTENPQTAVDLCERVPGLGLTLDPSHYLAGAYQDQDYDPVFPYVRHVHLRDSGREPNQFQVRIGQGLVEYGRIISQLARNHYDRGLTVDIHDIADAPFAMKPEVRKLKYLLESLV